MMFGVPHAVAGGEQNDSALGLRTKAPWPGGGLPLRTAIGIAGWWLAVCCAGLGGGAACFAQDYKPLPPPGIEIDEARLQALTERVTELEREIRSEAERSNDAGHWRADVEVLTRSVRLAVEQGLFYRPADPDRAAELLDLAAQRLQAAGAGERGLRLLGLRTEPSDKPQLLVGGFVSDIDDSVQPYGLVVPAEFRPNTGQAWRVDVWLHGRGDTKTEVPFILERLSKPGEYTPANTFVLHPFGRHCNAFKFAGETDVFESLEHLGQLVNIDPARVSIRGFSMGGAGCWHLAAHHPGRWLAANPGAGFVDTLVYQGWNDSPPFALDAVQRKLLRWYDVMPWARNFSNTRVIPYSGEIDKQRQAADRVVAVAKELGLEWPYVIGAGMGHKIDPASAEKIDQVIASWASEPTELPRREIDFVTYTLRYPGVDWLTVRSLTEHWEPGRVRARITGTDSMEIRTEGVTELDLDFASSGWPGEGRGVTIVIDGQTQRIENTDAATGLRSRLVRDGSWTLRSTDEPTADESRRKRPGMQGPIDDAFTGRFLFVTPSGKAADDKVQAWIDRELEFAQTRWRSIMRGDIRVIRDTELSEEQIADSHLVCFGDFGSNRYLTRVADRLPVVWTDDELRVGSHSFSPQTNVPVFCFPNPENPDRYVVINSGMTFREFSNVSNSRQIAMLPDWAVIDITESGRGIYPGGIAAKGFFDENWGLSDKGIAGE